MSNNRLLRGSIIGAVVAAICCFTPILVILLTAIGFSWITGYLDYVLLPVLFICCVIIVYALWQQRSHVSS